MRRFLACLLAATALAGCGGGDGEQEAGAPADSTRLRVEVTGVGDNPVRMQLVCGGRCDLEQVRGAVTHDPARACTLQYGGPEKARVTGTVEGRKVDVTLARADGCGIADYEALFAAFDRDPPLAP